MATVTVLVAIAVVLAGSWVWFQENIANDGESVDEALRRALPAAEKAGTPLRIADVITFDWDHLVFLCPYAGDEFVEASLSFSTDGEDFGPMYENGVGWVFTRDREIVARVDLPMSLGQPPSCGPRGRYERDKAVFRAKMDARDLLGSEAPYVRLVAVP